MRPLILTVAGMLALGALAAAPPAHAQLGAIAYDAKTGRYGMSWDQPTPKRAEADAISQCGATGCRIVIRLRARQCGAFASTENNKGVGAAARPSLDQARLAALSICNKRKAGECVVRLSHCNK
ncbi:MAG TPA: DUF4189 domain-containing protein [Stellaceae bacterium]|nr:DUF4189 domain-containing protein [Stellaceae bacterium]